MLDSLAKEPSGRTIAEMLVVIVVAVMESNVSVSCNLFSVVELTPEILLVYRPK